MLWMLLVFALVGLPILVAGALVVGDLVLDFWGEFVRPLVTHDDEVTP